MIEWYLMKSPVFGSGFENDEFSDYSENGFDEILNETPLGKNITLCKNTFDGVNFETEFKCRGIVQSETPDSQTQSFQRQLLTHIGTVRDYKYVKYDGSPWLIMNKPSNNLIYEKVILYQCNYIAKWGNIHQPFVIRSAGQYNLGEKNGKIINLGDGRLTAFTSADENTLALERGQRMFIDCDRKTPYPYRITHIDSVSYSYGENRIIGITFEESQYNPDTDDIDLMLCDCKTPEKWGV